MHTWVVVSSGLVAIICVLAVLFVPKTVMVKPELLFKDLSGQVWLVTGGNVGIGYETAKQLSQQGATVIIGCRNATRASSAVNKAAAEGVQLRAMTLDLADFDSIKHFSSTFTSKFQSLHGLVANAGVMVPPLQRTAQGHESQWGVNHLGHVLLVDLLLPLLEIASPPARIVVVSSRAGEFSSNTDLEDPDYKSKSYLSITAYAASKYANVLFAKVLATRLIEKGSTVSAVSLHPGAVLTELLRHIPFSESLVPLLEPLLLLVMKTPWQGAQTSLFASLAEGIPSGSYLSDCAVVQHALANKMDLVAEKLWAQSRADVGLPPWDPASN